MARKVQGYTLRKLTGYAPFPDLVYIAEFPAAYKLLDALFLMSCWLAAFEELYDIVHDFDTIIPMPFPNITPCHVDTYSLSLWKGHSCAPQ